MDRDDHRETGLPCPPVADESEALPLVQLLVDSPAVVADSVAAVDARLQYRANGLAIERHVLVLRRDLAHERARAGVGDPLLAARARAGGVQLLVEDVARPVAELVRARIARRAPRSEVRIVVVDQLPV